MPTNQSQEQAKTQAIEYAKWSHYDREDCESDEEFNGYISSLEEMFNNINTMPIKQAFELAEKDGWMWKHYKRVLEFILVF